MWKTISSKEIFKHPRLTLLEDEVMLPNGHKTKYLKYKDNGGCAVTVIAVNKDGKILLQREYSYPPNQKLFQFPGGGVPKGTSEAGANRELMEEANLKGNNLELLGSYLMNNRRSKALMYAFVAKDLVEESLEGDIEEDIESFWFSEEEIDEMIKDGTIIHIHTLSVWCLYKVKKQITSDNTA